MGLIVATAAAFTLSYAISIIGTRLALAENR